MNDPRPPEGGPAPDPAELDEGALDERLLDRELADGDEQLSAQLRRLLDPDSELGERTADDVGRALRSRSTLGAALDLLGTGWWTARSLLSTADLTEPCGAADGEREGT